MLNKTAIKTIFQSNQQLTPAELIPELLELGVKKYDYRLTTASYTIYGKGHSFELNTKLEPVTVSELGETLKTKQAVLQYQEGAITFPEFVFLAGSAGVAHWVCDLETNETTYFDQKDYILYTDTHPEI
ncbi:DUF1398 family protein [Enterococcus faecalis]